MSSTSLLDRRSFLRTTAAAGAGLCVGFYLPASRAQEKPRARKKPPNPFDAWIHDSTRRQRHAASSASPRWGRAFMTALPMILAEELRVDWKPGQGRAGPDEPRRSTTTAPVAAAACARSYLPLRQAGAAARDMFIPAAAERWSVNRGCLRRRGRRDSFTARRARKLVLWRARRGAAATLPLPELQDQVSLKDPRDFTIVGNDTRGGHPLEGGRRRGLRHRRPRSRDALRGDRPLSDLRRQAEILRRRPRRRRCRA